MKEFIPVIPTKTAAEIPFVMQPYPPTVAIASLSFLLKCNQVFLRMFGSEKGLFLFTV